MADTEIFLSGSASVIDWPPIQGDDCDEIPISGPIFYPTGKLGWRVSGISHSGWSYPPVASVRGDCADRTPRTEGVRLENYFNR
jgi:hypothetical protein